jgi:hypothetical protein
LHHVLSRSYHLFVIFADIVLSYCVSVLALISSYVYDLYSYINNFLSRILCFTLQFYASVSLVVPLFSSRIFASILLLSFPHVDFIFLLFIVAAHIHFSTTYTYLLNLLSLASRSVTLSCLYVCIEYLKLLYGVNYVPMKFKRKEVDHRMHNFALNYAKTHNSNEYTVSIWHTILLIKR